VTRPLRVLMTADTVGGVFTYALDLTRALAPLDVEVVLATMGRLPTREQRRAMAAIRNLTVVESSYRLEWMDDPWEDVARAGGFLLDLERRYAPDIVHLNGYAHAGLPFRAPVLVVAHSCVLSWWRAVKSEPAPERYAQYRDRVRAGLMQADHVVAPTQAMLRALERHYGRLPRASVIANGCDPTAFWPREKRPYVAAAGRMWDEAKNLETLDRAARALPWPVRIAGEAAAPEGSGAGERKAVGATMLGQLPRSAVAELLGHASVYAFPARYEPFGLSVLEAAASGCALVLSDIASFRELWEGAALFVAPNDERALADAIHALIADPSLREVLARRARFSARRFDLPTFANRYRTRYDELVATVKQERGESITLRAPRSPSILPLALMK
jgi:glycogen synthase